MYSHFDWNEPSVADSLLTTKLSVKAHTITLSWQMTWNAKNRIKLKHGFGGSHIKKNIDFKSLFMQEVHQNSLYIKYKGMFVSTLL